VDVPAGIGTRLIINCVHMWNLGSASGVTQWIVIVRGRVGTRLVINWVFLWIWVAPPALPEELGNETCH
jgi:hypothetical protein